MGPKGPRLSHVSGLTPTGNPSPRIVHCTPHERVLFYLRTGYPMCMIKSIKPKAGNWILLVGSRSLNATMLTAIACLEECRSVRVLDSGNRFTASTVARAAGGQEKEDAS